MDSKTMDMMNMPRCGLKDKKSKRMKRYDTASTPWSKHNLTYKILNYSKQLKKSDIDVEIEKAASLWSQYTQLQINRILGKPDMYVSFEVGDHDDGFIFDGPGKTIAHTDFPKPGIPVHFDDDENWTIRSYKGINLQQTAVHEFGHALGLGHSESKSAVMSPFYRGYDPRYEIDLDEDDIKGIQALYGDNNEKLCKDFLFDTIFKDKNDNIYIFKVDSYWKLVNNTLVGGYPRKIVSTWSELPENIDAAYFDEKSMKTYFFKDDKYWVYSEQILDTGYPKTFSFSGVPTNLDAVTVWNGTTYFFKDKEYWTKIENISNGITVYSYDRNSLWDGAPNRIDAALEYNGSLYLYNKNQPGVYYEFDGMNTKKKSLIWIGCSFLEPKNKLVFYPNDKSVEKTNKLTNSRSSRKTPTILYQLFLMAVFLNKVFGRCTAF